MFYYNTPKRFFKNLEIGPIAEGKGEVKHSALCREIAYNLELRRIMIFKRSY